MRRASHWFELLCLLLLSLYCISAVDAGSRRRQSLDGCDSILALTIMPDTNGTVVLSWLDVPGVSEWIIYRATCFDMHDICIAAVVRDTNVWIEDTLVVAANPRLFYRIAAKWDQGSSENYWVIEDFSNPIQLASHSAEDVAPNSWHLTMDGAYNPYTLCLELYGNTWKRQTIEPVHAGSGALWRVAMKSVASGEVQAFGIADSANELWYPVWGSEIRQSEAWNTTYQGWFPRGAWAFADLPVGDDWMGRFGYYPNINALLYANDNDESSGVLRIGEIRDVTGTVNIPPYARFEWRITGVVRPDSFDVAFCSMGCDPEGPLYRAQWSFGDGTSGVGLWPTHRYQSGGEYVVTFTVLDSMNRCAWARQTVFDTVTSPSRRMTALFGGDVMMARRYESEGIISAIGVNGIFERVRPLVSAADLAICNLECPLTLATEHHPTKLYYFKGRPEYVAGPQYAGFDFVALANNHNFDYLVDGMRDTKRALDSVGILSTGAGDNADIASQPVFFTKNGLCVAILSFCNRDGSFDNEQPFLAAGPGKPGFAMWDRASIELNIPAARAFADLVIVQVHSGEEYATAPPALAALGYDRRSDLVRTFELLPDTGDVSLRRYALDMGADLVINHHPHVIQGCEVYHGKLIAHSLGNFAFDQTFPETFVSMAITADLSAEHGVGGFGVRPIYIDRCIPGPATGELGGAILDYISELSRPMNTWVVRNPDSAVGAIVLDTTGLRLATEQFRDTLWLETRNGYSVSEPLKLHGAGYPVNISVIAPDSAEFRFGHDVFMVGNIEAEGATPWNLNSSYERYDTTTALRGRRSISLNRAGGGSNSVSTTLVQRPTFDPNRDYTMLGWIMAQRGREVQIQFELYNQRTGDNLLLQQTVGGAYAGTFEWMLIWDDVADSIDGYFYNIRLNLRAPSTGEEGWAWFDDLALVQWESWQTDQAALGFPNSLGWAQVRAPLGTTMAVIEYTRAWVNIPERTDFRNLWTN
jgi:poly-gamma-glutamate capsule biosynthesis protein CapA/YwtB (metallophosphatase superfamily)